LRTVVVVKNDNPTESFAQLKGKTMAMPICTREHSRLFIARQCGKCGRTEKEHFSGMPETSSIEDALDDVFEGKVSAAVSDLATLEAYGNRKPGRYARLRVIQSSEMFPAGVIACRKGGLDEASLQRFRHGMETANQSAYASRMMRMMKIQAFEPIPANYDQIMAEIVKAYPPPGVVPVSTNISAKQ